MSHMTPKPCLLDPAYSVLYEDQIDPFLDAYIEALLDQVEALTGDELDYDKVLFTIDEIIVTGTRRGGGGSGGGGFNLVATGIDYTRFTNFDYYNLDYYVGTENWVCEGEQNDDTCTLTETQNNDDESTIPLVATLNNITLALIGDDEALFAHELLHQLECSLETALESAKDAIAQTVKELIDAMNPADEHGAVLIRDFITGETIRLEIIDGDANQIDPIRLIETITEAGYSLAEVIGVIHSHTASDSTDPATIAFAALLNNAPSHGDYAFANSLAELFRETLPEWNVPGSADATTYQNWVNNFSLYIIGTPNADGNTTLYQYDGLTNPNLNTNISADDAEALERLREAAAQAAEDATTSDCSHD